MFFKRPSMVDWKAPLGFGLSPSILGARKRSGTGLLCSRIRAGSSSCRLYRSMKMCLASEAEVKPETTKIERIKVRSIQDAEESIVGTEVKVNGWLRTVRDQKQFAFLNINDGSSLSGVQIVVDGSSGSYDTAKSLTTGSSVSVVGTVVKSPGKGQKYEIQAKSLHVFGTADQSYPLQKKRHSFEFLRGIAHLRARTNAIGAVARVRSSLAYSTHKFFCDRGFVYLNSPILTASDAEGAGELFQVTTLPVTKPEDIKTTDSGEADFAEDFFEKPTFLTVSGQLSAESYATALSDVYTFGPTFRAENSNTSRHLAEFWMVEPEMAFADLQDDMANAEAYVKYCINYVLENNAEDVEFFSKFVEKGLMEKLETVRREPFASISYTEAVQILQESKAKFVFPVEWGTDLQSEHERYLAEKHFQKPVFVYNYPVGIKAFYMRLNDDQKTVAAMDLLVPGIGELVGGSQREERLDLLEKRIADAGLEKVGFATQRRIEKKCSIQYTRSLSVGTKRMFF
uniref:asparagine--tRNA ligase n=2 Tax=Rhodosorus marinus TaxID=101924 RepID=A0A7S2ZMY6_9RHOD|mmetsp:Transcript_24767/g.97902  ORF Transcript_24767/g.97902 Transcript_24767/m.97902 type:complete len:513 (+) Transcript_24767:83-1621(+)